MVFVLASWLAAFASFTGIALGSAFRTGKRYRQSRAAEIERWNRRRYAKSGEFEV